MKKIFYILVFTILLSIYLPANILMPVTADAKAEKSVLRPGETVKITLLNFRDQNNRLAGSGEDRFQGYKMKFDFPKSRQDFKGKTAKRVRRMQQFLLQNFAATQVHPDHVFKKGNGKTFFGGQGKWEKKKSSGSNFHKKTYTWERHISE